jgi:hypothetical protein
VTRVLALVWGLASITKRTQIRKYARSRNDLDLLGQEHDRPAA